MRLKAIVEASSRDGIMKTKPAYSLISLGKKAPTKNSPNEPKSESREQSLLKSFFIKLKKKLILPYVAFRDIEQGTRNFH